MIISLLGIGSDTLLENFDAVGIKYARRLPPPRTVLNSGELIEILNVGSTLASIASCLFNWLSFRDSRQVIIIQSGMPRYHLEGKSVEEIEKLLISTKKIMVLETKKPEQ